MDRKNIKMNDDCKKTKIYFYADKSFWKKQEYTSFILDFFVRNRIDIPYREKFEFMIMSMTDTVNHKEGEVYLHLEIQNYLVGKIVNKSEQYPDGVEWDK